MRTSPGGGAPPCRHDCTPPWWRRPDHATAPSATSSSMPLSWHHDLKVAWRPCAEAAGARRLHTFHTASRVIGNTGPDWLLLQLGEEGRSALAERHLELDPPLHAAWRDGPGRRLQFELGPLRAVCLDWRRA
jgi:hypothetical protein